jgi:hypothetical protein
MDFSRMDVWQVCQASAENSRALAKPSAKLQVEKSEGGGRPIFWDGKQYAWQQRGY